MTSPLAPSGVAGDRVDRPLALELAQDLLVRPPDDVREDVEPAAVGHPDRRPRARPAAAPSSIASSSIGTMHVEALDRELLLPEERALEVVLEALDLGQPLEQQTSFVGGERLPVAAGLDRLPEPDALLVVRDVLDLVGDRPAVDLARAAAGRRRGSRPRRRRRSTAGRDLRLELGRQLRARAAPARAPGRRRGSEPSGSRLAAR